MKNTIFYFSCFIFIFLCSGICSGDENLHSVTFQTQEVMNENAKVEFKKADKELNELYNSILNLLNDEDKEKFIDAQNAWIKYRDLHCDAATSRAKGGSAYYLFKFSCLKELTKQRITALEAAYPEEIRKGMTEKNNKGRHMGRPLQLGINEN
jgi:uncharacterized protein YecT (DUF1311 family)